MRTGRWALLVFFGISCLAIGRSWGETLAELTVAATPRAADTWESFLGRVYEGSALSPKQALPLVVLANRRVLSCSISLADNPPIKSLRLPRAAIVAEPHSFLTELQQVLVQAFEDRLERAGFEELEARYDLLHDLLLPLFAEEAEIIRCQLDFDIRVIKAFERLNDGLFVLRNHRPYDIELATRVRQSVVDIEMEMARAVSAPQLMVRESLQRRLARYRTKYVTYLEDEVIRRLRELSRVLMVQQVERGREMLLTLVKRVLPLLSDFFVPAAIRIIEERLCRAHLQYIAPRTRERSLPFALCFQSLVSVLAPPAERDNYAMGTKISDDQFHRLVTSRQGFVRTDCSGFIGRVYRELARVSGFGLEGFVVSCSGAISSQAMITARCSTPVEIDKDGRRLRELKQGDIFYFELPVRGQRDRHVCFFERLVRHGNRLKVSLWEASPGGVRQRIRPADWVVKRISSEYGYPRGGAYRLCAMDDIDTLFQRGRLRMK